MSGSISGRKTIGGGRNHAAPGEPATSSAVAMEEGPKIYHNDTQVAKVDIPCPKIRKS
jgi:hypothetical protein